MRKVLFVTGIRSEYDILCSIMRSVQKRADMEVALVVTGAHLSPMYGYTISEVEKDGFPIIARIESLLNSDSAIGRVKSAAIQLSGLIDVIAQHRPSFVVAPMDREEAITVAMAGAYMQIPVVHVGGGDTAEDGNIDNSVRHAVTKLSHLHMVTTHSSAARVIALGEEPFRVHITGAPGLDRLVELPDIPSADLWGRLGYDPGNEPFAILIQHSIISDVDRAGELMAITIESLVSIDLPAFVSYPNSDAGSQQIIDVIETYSKRYPGLLHKYQNLPRIEFVNLMRRAHVMVGNSSCGIIEAPLFHLPVVNIGPRQRGREHSNNVQFVDHDSAQIRSAIRRAVFDEEYRRSVGQCENPYGDGHAGERFAAILATVPIDEELLAKRITY
jgi:GDP/UDP-N,N'-diacetylbacillosamine 2-epimerase (hydrolysing)